MKELSQIQGKNVIDQTISFFGFVIHFKARLVKDEEWPKTRFLLDEENMAFDIEGTPANETSPGPDRLEELARVVEATARKAVRKMNAQ